VKKALKVSFRKANDAVAVQNAFVLVKQGKKNWKLNGKYNRHKNLKILWLLGCLPGKAVEVESLLI
jgi:hypothetical protein